MEKFYVDSWVRQCVKKVRYNYESHAKKVAKNVFKTRGVKLRVYMCPKCLGYHLTKSELVNK